MPSEALKRRDAFNEEQSEAVRMSDGQDWYLPRPVLVLNHRFEAGEPAGRWRAFSYGPEIDRVLERIGAATEPVESVTLVIGLAARLLLWNYDLSDDDLAKILFYRIGDPDSDRVLRDVVDVVTGGLFRHGGRGVLDDPKTAVRWVRAGLVAAGFSGDSVTLADAVSAARMLAHRGRIVDLDDFSPAVAQRRANDQSEAFMEGLL